MDEDKQNIIKRINNLQAQLDKTSNFDIACLLSGQILLLEYSLRDIEKQEKN